MKTILEVSELEASSEYLAEESRTNEEKDLDDNDDDDDDKNSFIGKQLMRLSHFDS